MSAKDPILPRSASYPTALHSLELHVKILFSTVVSVRGTGRRGPTTPRAKAAFQVLETQSLEYGTQSGRNSASGLGRALSSVTPHPESPELQGSCQFGMGYYLVLYIGLHDQQSLVSAPSSAPRPSPNSRSKALSSGTGRGIRRQQLIRGAREVEVEPGSGALHVGGQCHHSTSSYPGCAPQSMQCTSCKVLFRMIAQGRVGLRVDF